MKLVPLLVTCWICASTRAQDECSFDGRINSLRCQGVSLREVQSGLKQIGTQVQNVFVNFCDIPAISEPLLKDDHQPIKIRAVAIMNSGLKELGLDALVGLESALESLDLSGNQLQSVPRAVLNLTRLTHLDLSRNQIGLLPHGSAFNNLNGLVSLKLGGNMLGSVLGSGGQIEGQDGDQVKFRLKRPSLSLLAFNLEPLTDTLEELDLSSNAFKALPMQLQGRQFNRLRILDLSQNPLGQLPSKAFSGMSSLEVLNLEQAQLVELSQHLEPLVQRLRLFKATGNPLRCDCKLRWLWNHLQKEDHHQSRLDLPKCATPFSVKSRDVNSLSASELCELLLPGEQKLKFFRVSDQDKDSFPAKTFESLSLVEAEASSTTEVAVTWRVSLDFYFTDFDWGLIFREIGDDSNPNMFYKTNYDLKQHISRNSEWSPGNESVTAGLSDLEPDAYYEICLAAIDHATVYYIHRDNCQELRMPPNEDWSLSKRIPKSEEAFLAQSNNISFIPNIDSITISWKANFLKEWQTSENVSLVRRISLRRFGQDNTTQVYILEDFENQSDNKNNGTRYYTVEDLVPGTGYAICFDTLVQATSPDPDVRAKKSLDLLPVTNEDTSGLVCEEVVTLAMSAKWERAFPVTEVATASIVSTSTTVVVVILIFCCCFPKCCKSAKDDDSKGSRDENDNHKAKTKKDEEELVDIDIDQDDADLESVKFRSILSGSAETSTENENRNESMFQDRYSTASLPRTRQGHSEPSSISRRFSSTFRGDQEVEVEPEDDRTGLYSQYDYTIHSEARPKVGKSSKKAKASKKRRASSPDLPDPYDTPLMAMGPGSYHTISHFQFYRPHHHHHHPPTATAVHNPFYTELHYPPHQQPPLSLMAPPPPQPEPHPAFEMRTLKVKKANKANNYENYKMFTWSPYTSNGLALVPRLVRPGGQRPLTMTTDYPYTLREPFISRKNGDELRF